MRLTELDPTFVRYETRIETWDVVVGDHETWHDRGCPTESRTGPREYAIPVATLTEAQGLRLLCPMCFGENGGPVGTHALEVTFHDRGAADEQGSHGRSGTPSRWYVSGVSYADLTLQPSIDLTPGCRWHGHITNGEVS